MRTNLTRVLRAVSVVALALGLTPLGAGASTRHTYVALGDSYSSGEGLAPFLAGSGSCDRSARGYPSLVASALHFSSFSFVACSGATTAQIEAQVSALSARVATSAALTTVTAGGNDLPFSGLIAACIGAAASTTSAVGYVPGVSSASACQSAISAAASLLGVRVNAATGQLSAVPARSSPEQTRLATLFHQILRVEGVAPHASGPRLVVVSYPTLLVLHGNGSCLLAATPLVIPGVSTTTPAQALYPAFARSDAAQLVTINRDLNVETAQVVAQLRRAGYLGVSFAPANGFLGIDCASGTSPELNGLLLASVGSTTASGSFHPTATGQAALATYVEAQWSRGR